MISSDYPLPCSPPLWHGNCFGTCSQPNSLHGSRAITSSLSSFTFSPSSRHSSSLSIVGVQRILFKGFSSGLSSSSLYIHFCWWAWWVTALPLTSSLTEGHHRWEIGSGLHFLSSCSQVAIMHAQNGVRSCRRPHQVSMWDDPSPQVFCNILNKTRLLFGKQLEDSMWW